MNNILSWRHWLTMAFIACGVLFCFVAIPYYRVTDHQEILELIKELREEQRDILAEMLRIRAGLVSSFDNLVKVHSHGTANATKLNKLFDKNSQFDSRKIFVLLDSYEAQRKNDLESIDLFKRTVSIVRNSLHYLPTIADNAHAEGIREESNQEVESLLHDVLLYTVQPDKESEDTLTATIAKFETSSVSPEREQSLRLFVRHIRNVLDGEAVVQRILRTFSGDDWKRSLEDVVVEYTRLHSRAVVYGERCQSLLSILLVVLCLYVALLVSKLRSTFSLLRASNTNLVSALERAEAASAAKGAFLANMSHEIRTPLNGIVGSLHILQRGKLDVQQREFLTVALRSSEGLSTIINDVLDFSKIEAGKMELSEELMDLREVVEYAVQAQLSRADEKGLVLGSIVERSVPEFIRSDKVRLGQILLNLVSNAVKFTSSGGIQVEVRCMSRDAQTCSLRFEVKDSGIGISKEQQALLFQSFSQADVSTTKKYGGTGLGLAICKQLVSKLNGNIGIESEPGKGSTFWFEITVPYEKGAFGTDRYFKLRQNKIRILLVGGNADYQDLLSRQLRNWGFVSLQVSQLTYVRPALEVAKHAGEPISILLVTGGEVEGLVDELQSSSWKEEFPEMPIGVIVGSESEAEYSPLIKNGLARRISRTALQSNLFDSIINLLASMRNDPSETGSGGSSSEWSVQGTEFSHTRILLAEDNEINQLIARELLKIHGIVPVIVSNGRLAYEAFKQGTFDLVLLDCHMPEMDGFEAAENIREIERARGVKGDRHVPIVALTADVTTEAQERCKLVGMNSFLSKPLDPAKLYKTLQTYLRSPRNKQWTR